MRENRSRGIYATNMIFNNTDILLVSKALDHASIETTKIYDLSSVETLKAAWVNMPRVPDFNKKEG